MSSKGRKLEYVLVSEDETQYCEGICRRMGKEPKATENFEQAKKNFKRGSVWKVSMFALAKQNPKYLGCSCKRVIDMNLSTFTLVLQCPVKMPTQPAPPEDLATPAELP